MNHFSRSIAVLLTGWLCVVDPNPLSAQRAVSSAEETPFAPRRYVVYLTASGAEGRRQAE